MKKIIFGFGLLIAMAYQVEAGINHIEHDGNGVISSRELNIQATTSRNNLYLPDDSIGINQSNGISADENPLKVNLENPRYLSDESGKTIYLVGSHTWLSFQDVAALNPLSSPVFDYEGYLDTLVANNLNFIRMWTWEEAWTLKYSTCIHLEPSLFERTGPGKGNDQQPKFDLNKFNPEYFQKLRERVIAANDKGMYVSIMLFQGFSVARKVGARQFSPWNFHPFNKNNNINGIDGDANNDGEGYEVHTLQNSFILTIQKTYIRKIIDELHDLDNIFFEISNESHGNSTQWQYEMINYIHQYESSKPKQHLVWMSFQWDGISGPGTNENLFNSPADIISPAGDAYITNPPVAPGSKIIIADTDHIDPGDLDRRKWVWKMFTRGYHPIIMAPLGESNEEKTTREAMGTTLWFANLIDLKNMTPTDLSSISSTQYCLYNEGKEYLVYQPGSGSFSVNLPQGEYNYKWFNPISNLELTGGTITASGGTKQFTPPFSGDAVLYLVEKNFATSSLIKTSNPVQEDYLSENYPNPFQTLTAIKYVVPEYSDVKIQIFDINGGVVKTLVNKELQAGQYVIEWNGSDGKGTHLPNGTYFCQLKTASFVQTKKMTLRR